MPSSERRNKKAKAGKTGLNEEMESWVILACYIFQRHLHLMVANACIIPQVRKH
jgi:hypothetical protein